MSACVSVILRSGKSGFKNIDVSNSNITAIASNKSFGVCAYGDGTLNVTDCEITSSTASILPDATVTVNLIGSNSFTPAYP